MKDKRLSGPALALARLQRYLITTFKRVPRGTEGAVSLEGTLAGVVGSLALGAAGVAAGLVAGRAGLALCAAAALVATTCESLIGATAQGRCGPEPNPAPNPRTPPPLGARFRARARADEAQPPPSRPLAFTS